MTQTSTTTARAGLMIHEFLEWYYLSRPRKIVTGYAAYAKAFSAIFSFLYLLKTLFTPWKAIADAYPSKGFQLSEILSTFAVNMTARMIGAVIRLVTIVIGLVVQFACFCVFVVYLFAWLFLPFLVLASIVFIFLRVL